MSGFGSTLRFAREQKGLSIAQVAEMTRLSPTMVELLEHENFSMIPAPLYGRGFVKLFSQAVGLDPKPMIEQFMQLYEQNSATERTPPPIPATPTTPIAPEPPPVTGQLRMESPRAAEPAPAPASARPVPPSRYAAPQPIDERPSLTTVIFCQLHRIPSHVWRLATLVLGAVILISFIFFGVRALYRATSDAPAAAEVTTDETAQETSAEAMPMTETEPAAPVEPTAAKPRRGTVIEPLYVD